MTCYRGQGWELQSGAWEESLAGVREVDAIVTDPPYGARVHAGHDSAIAGDESRRDLGYAAWAPEHVEAFVSAWAPRCKGWIVALTSHDLYPAWASALEGAGRYVFAPLPVVIPGMTVRLVGDGPSSWAVWCVVARPRKAPFSRWGTLPGAYSVSPGDRSSSRIGGKPLALMAALCRDYSRPGDLVCDPCAGMGTTILGALQTGRRAIGAELDPKVARAAAKRLRGGYTPEMF